MACPVSHIIYANKYFEKNPSHQFGTDEFILGCVFPDIRRIDKSIRRKDTHLRFKPVDLNFEGLDSFNAGWKYHVYCDMKREEILNKYKFYSLNNAGDAWGLAGKFLEDEIIYGKCNNWEKIVYYFENAPKINTGIGVSCETMNLWYAIVAKYVQKKPDSRAMKIFLSKQADLAELSGTIVESVDKLRKNAKAKEILEKVCEEIV